MPFASLLPAPSSRFALVAFAGAAVFALTNVGCTETPKEDKEDLLLKKAPLATTTDPKVLEKAAMENGKIKPTSPDGEPPKDDTNADDAVDSVYKAQAVRFVDLFTKTNFSEVVKMFNEAMAQAATPKALKGAWQKMETDMGAYKHHLKPRQQTNPDKVRVTTELVFEKGKIDMQLIFDRVPPNDTALPPVVGMRIAPVPTAEELAAAEKAKKKEDELPEGHPGTGKLQKNETLPDGVRQIPLASGAPGWPVNGTLTLPAGTGPFPAVILVHGSGPSDRDGTLGPNKPLRELAWGLAERGIAAYRYDKRTLIHSKRVSDELAGKFTLTQETVEDAVAAATKVREMPQVDPKNVFVLGHSLGGHAIPRILLSDKTIKGGIVMAGNTRPLEDIIVAQTKYILELDGKISAEEKPRLENVQKMAADVEKLTRSSTNTPFGLQPAYWLDLEANKPQNLVKKTKQPYLVLQGGRDYQSTSADYNEWRSLLAGRKGTMFKKYKGLNHIFHEGKGKSVPNEYLNPGAMPPYVFNDITAWVKARARQ